LSAQSGEVGLLVVSLRRLAPPLELRNGSVLANSRSLATGSRQARVQARSDDAGATWTPSRFVGELASDMCWFYMPAQWSASRSQWAAGEPMCHLQPEPFNGCQGSLAGGAAAGGSGAWPYTRRS